MNKNIQLVAETGADIPQSLADRYGITLVPMHVTLNDRTMDDGSFPTEEICKYYEQTGKLPKTSGCSPLGFEKVFHDLHMRYPDKHILHLAYSAATTCSYHSAKVAAQDATYITSIDTKHVSAGQGMIVLQLAKLLEENVEMSVQQTIDKAKELCRRTRMCFLPKDLEYLRAGGRVSNVVCLGGRLLSVHPCIETIDGHLVAKKKYRGKLETIVPLLIKEYTSREHISREQLVLIRSIGLSETVQRIAETAAEECGFQSVQWVQTGCVITAHGGPGCFGIVGFSMNAQDNKKI